MIMLKGKYVMRKLFVAGLFLLLIIAAFPATAIAQQPENFQYVVKVICGRSYGDVLERGTNTTAVNVHNPIDTTVTFRKKLAIASPREAGPIVQLETSILEADEALEIDCQELHSMTREQTGRGHRLIKGFVVIDSNFELDVVAVYTASGWWRAVKSVDVEYVEPRRR